MRFFILVLTFFSFAHGFYGQRGCSLSITNDSIAKIVRYYQKTHKDSVSLVQYLRAIRFEAIKRGFPLASYDSLFWQKKHCRTNFFLGPQIKNIQLSAEDIKALAYGDQLKIKQRSLQNIPFRPSDIGRMMKETEERYLNKGYPFCRIWIGDLTLNSSGLFCGKLYVDKGDEYRFSQIVVKGDSSLSNRYISTLLNINPGDIFDESKLKHISEKIRQVPFLTELKPHELLFTENNCEVYIYLRSNPVSSANGTIGLQPNPNNNRVGLAGELNLKLMNILKRGEQAQLNWRSIQDQTQSMLFKINYPFLFKTAFGMDGNLQLYKKDSTFLEVRSTIGVQYFLLSGTYLKAYFQQYANNLLSGANATGSSFQNLANINTSSYGLSITRRSFDYLPNPSKGHLFLLEGAVGNRKSKDMDSIQTVRTSTYRVHFQMEMFLPLTRRHILRCATVNEFYYAPRIYENELFRFGGQLSLRGFNEDELFASSRSVTTLEYRYLLDRNSNLFIFYDQGFYENKAAKYRKDHPYGFGAGLSFGTNLGIFSLSYGLGSQQGNPLRLRNGKIHFGYIAYF